MPGTPPSQGGDRGFESRTRYPYGKGEALVLTIPLMLKVTAVGPDALIALLARQVEEPWNAGYHWCGPCCDRGGEELSLACKWPELQGKALGTPPKTSEPRVELALYLNQDGLNLRMIVATLSVSKSTGSLHLT